VKQIIGFLLQDLPLHGSGPGPGCMATRTERMWAGGGNNFPPWGQTLVQDCIF